MKLPWSSIGAFLCALSVLAGAFGAHGLERHLGPDELDLWETAARYLMYSGLALLGLGALFRQGRTRLVDGAALALVSGGSLFSATVAILALGGPRWLGMVTPVGGLLLIVGLVLLSWAALRRGM